MNTILNHHREPAGMQPWLVLIESLGKNPIDTILPPKHVHESQSRSNHCSQLRAKTAARQREKMINAILAVMQPGEQLKTEEVGARIGKSGTTGAVKRRLNAMHRDGLLLKHVGKSKALSKMLLWEVATC